MFCTNCGMKNPRDSIFCGDCGRRIKFEVENGESIEEITRGKKERYYTESLKIQKEKLKLEKQKNKGQNKYMKNMAKCPRCGSTSLSGHKKGYGIGKAVVGTWALGPLGLMAGNIGAGNIRVTCLNCGKKFKA